jgi:hypothetical protein
MLRQVTNGNSTAEQKETKKGDEEKDWNEKRRPKKT